MHICPESLSAILTAKVFKWWHQITFASPENAQHFRRTNCFTLQILRNRLSTDEQSFYGEMDYTLDYYGLLQSPWVEDGLWAIDHKTKFSRSCWCHQCENWNNTFFFPQHNLSTKVLFTAEEILNASGDVWSFDILKCCWTSSTYQCAVFHQKTERLVQPGRIVGDHVCCSNNFKEYCM